MLRCLRRLFPQTGRRCPAAPAAPGAEATPLAQWWQRFGDPQLTELVGQALQAHTSVRSAQAALQQARAQAQVQQAGLRPSVNASGSAQRSRSAGSTGNSFQLGFDAAWEPDVFGRLHAGADASEADARAAAQAGWRRCRCRWPPRWLSTTSPAGLQERLSIAQRNLASQRETLQMTDWRVQAGLTTSLVSEQARAAAEQTAAQIPQLQANLAQSRHALAVLTGRAPGRSMACSRVRALCPGRRTTWCWPFRRNTAPAADVRQAEERIAAALARGRRMQRATPAFASVARWACGR